MRSPHQQRNHIIVMPVKSKEARRLESLKAAAAYEREQRQHAYDNQLKVYEERDLLVGVLARVYPSHLMQNHRNGKPVLCIHSPAGQLAWTLHTASDSLRAAIADLPVTENDWDQAKTADRLERLRSLASAQRCTLSEDPA